MGAVRARVSCRTAPSRGMGRACSSEFGEFLVWTCSGKRLSPRSSLRLVLPHSSGGTPQRPDAGQGRLGWRERVRPPLRCSAPTAAPATRCRRRRLGSALTAASGDSSSGHDHSPGSLPVAGSPVATPAALPRSRRRRLLPPLPACRLRSAPTPARRPVPLDPGGDAQPPLGCRCSLSLHRSRIRS